MTAAVHSAAGAVSVIGWLIVLGCLAAAAVCAYRTLSLACALLLVVTVVAAALLL